MNAIELKDGFLVKDWTVEIAEIKYFKTDYLYFGNVVERFIVFNSNNQMLPPIEKSSSDKIFDNHKDAVKHAADKKKERIKYCEKQIKEYQEQIDEFKKKL